MPIDLNKIEEQLHSVNNIVGQLNPLIGLIGGLAELAIHTAHKVGVDPQAFEAAYADYQTKRLALAAALDEFHQKYPVTPPPTQ